MTVTADTLFTVTADTLFQVCDATWPAAEMIQQDGWTLRRGAGGGKRVSAATLASPGADIATAETAMLAWDQTPLFMLRDEPELDQALADRGYAIVDPVNMYACPVTRHTDTPIPPVTAFTIWEPLAIMREIWQAGGIGPARLNVMARARQKTSVFSRWNDRPAGVGFAAIHDHICMVHAVEVLPDQRRQGVAQWIMRKAAFWAADHGATHISVLCTQANTAANALYETLGMTRQGTYHYRQHPGG